MIKEIHFPLYSPAWKQWRWDHIGGSDIAAVCAGYNYLLAETSWTPPLKYYLQMIGEPIQPFMGNVNSNMGQILEPIIINLYRFYDRTIPPEPDNTIPLMEMFKNRDANKRINRIICRHNYSYNTDTPHMSGSPDGFIYEDQGRGIIEIKNMTSMEQNRYANKINPAHTLQCQHNMYCTGAEYCDLIRLIDGAWMDVMRIKRDQDQIDFIIECAADFWTRVLEARSIKERFNIEQYYDMPHDFFNDAQLEAIGELQAIEPDFVGSQVELNWLKEYIKPVEDTVERDISGTEARLLDEYAEAKRTAKQAEKGVNRIQEELIVSMKGYQVVNTDQGYYSYKTNKNGTPRFYVQPKLLAAL